MCIKSNPQRKRGKKRKEEKRKENEEPLHDKRSLIRCDRVLLSTFNFRHLSHQQKKGGGSRRRTKPRQLNPKTAEAVKAVEKARGEKTLRRSLIKRQSRQLKVNHCPGS